MFLIQQAAFKKYLTFSILVLCYVTANAQEEKQQKYMDIYSAIVLDAGYDFGRVNPDYYDVMRPTQTLNKLGNEYQPQGVVFMGVRQSRLGIKNYFNTGLGELKTWFEFDLFGPGANAGKQLSI